MWRDCGRSMLGQAAFFTQERKLVAVSIQVEGWGGISGVWEDRLDSSCLQPRTIVAGARMQLSDTNLYSVLMTLPYDFVSTRQIWHILRLYHRGHMVAAALEIACESVAGELSQKT